MVKGAAAVAPEGIVGQIFLASRHAARILLVSDHNSGVDAIVQRTRARGIVQGTIDTIMLSPASRSVAGKRNAISWPAGTRDTLERPKSPCSACPIQYTYCTGSGWG